MFIIRHEKEKLNLIKLNFHKKRPAENMANWFFEHLSVFHCKSSEIANMIRGFLYCKGSNFDSEVLTHEP